MPEHIVVVFPGLTYIPGSVEFRNYYLEPETYEWAFREAGFDGFRWAGPYLHPSHREDPLWDAFMSQPPVIGFSAARP